RNFESSSLQRRVCKLSVPERRTHRRENSGAYATTITMGRGGGTAACAGLYRCALCGKDRGPRAAAARERAGRLSSDHAVGYRREGRWRRAHHGSRRRPCRLLRIVRERRYPQCHRPVPLRKASMPPVARTDCIFGFGNLLLRHRVFARASRRALACQISQSGLAKSPCRGFATRVPRRCRTNGSAPAFLLDALPGFRRGDENAGRCCVSVKNRTFQDSKRRSFSSESASVAFTPCLPSHFGLGSPAPQTSPLQPASCRTLA